MRIRVRAGDVTIEVDGLDYTRPQVKALANYAAGLHAALNETEQPEANPIGFSLGASTDLAPDPQPESYFTDDEE